MPYDEDRNATCFKKMKIRHTVEEFLPYAGCFSFLYFTFSVLYHESYRTVCIPEERTMFKNCRQIMAKADKAFMYGIILLKGRTENGDLF